MGEDAEGVSGGGMGWRLSIFQKTLRPSTIGFQGLGELKYLKYHSTIHVDQNRCSLNHKIHKRHKAKKTAYIYFQGFCFVVFVHLVVDVFIALNGCNEEFGSPNTQY